MLQNLIGGLTVLGTKDSIIWIIAGSLGGMIFGVIPGLGGIVILSITLALVSHISLEGMLCVFLGVQAASFFSASITSILLNTPAHPEAFAVTFDGFPMAQKGEAGRALGISATATCLGGVFGCIALVGFIQILSSISVAFHPPEYIALIVLSLVLVGTLGTDSVSKGLISAGFGVILASIGSSSVTGADRYTFGSVGLLDGISLVGLALGCFALPQMFLVFGTSTTVARQDMNGRDVEDTTPVELGRGFSKQIMQGVFDTFHHWVVLIISAIVGVVTGIIPGIGAFAANFLSYGLAKQTSPNRRLFGTGVAEGIIAPEGSSLSKEAGGMIPVMGLGIPGGVGGALFLAALDAKGIRVGGNFTTTYKTLPYEIAWIILITGIIGTFAGLAAAPILARITKVPGPLLVPFIMALSIFGTFIASGSLFSVMECLIFGVVGLALRRLQYSLASFVVGLVLGPTFEANFYLTHNLYHGVSFLKLPLTDVIIGITVAFLVSKAVQTRHDKKISAAEGGQEFTADEKYRRDVLRHPYPVLALIMTSALLGGSTFFLIYGLSKYSFVTAVMPVAGSLLVAGVSLFRMPFEIRNLVRYIHVKNMDKHLFSQGQVFSSASQVELPTTTGDQLSSDDVGAAQMGSVLLGDVRSTTLVAGPRSLPTPEGFEPIVERAWGRHGQYSREVVCVGWLIFLVLICFLFGFTVGMPIFTAAFALTATHRVLRTLKGRVLFGATSALFLWGLSFELSSLLHLIFRPVFSF